MPFQRGEYPQHQMRRQAIERIAKPRFVYSDRIKQRGTICTFGHCSAQYPNQQIRRNRIGGNCIAVLQKDVDPIVNYQLPSRCALRPRNTPRQGLQARNERGLRARFIVAKPDRMNLATLLDQLQAGSNTHRINIPASWHQGRTAFGGLSSVLAYQAAKLADGDLPPLQSAQIAFVGPLSGEVEVTATVLRRGKNTAFVKAEIAGADGVGLSCTFIFMNRRHSHLDYEGLVHPEFPPIPTAEGTRSGSSEYFTGHMQYPEKRLELGMATARLASWHRFTEHEGLDHIAELICIGDALPPSAMGLMTEKGMVSSMNWQINMLTDAPATKDGWWYLESETHHAANGASSQYMTAWNSDGQPMLTGMQSVAIFV